MRQPIWFVDAFVGDGLLGNPAGVCPLAGWLPDDVMQKIAAANGLPETAFFVPDGEVWTIRWFTPTIEVPLCGHATLASAWVVFNALGHKISRLRFRTTAGLDLAVDRGEDGLIALDFPTGAVEPDDTPGLAEALGRAPRAQFAGRNFLALFDDEATVRALSPNLDRIVALGRAGTVVTAPGRGCDFVSRYFAPQGGIPEDPVTGGAHTVLVPFWAKRLGRTKLHARQVSARGGELFCELRGDRVTMAGRAKPAFAGTLVIEADGSFRREAS